MTRLAVAACSARLLAEAAAQEGHEVVALDLFGDRDTQRAARQWRRIGDAASLRIDADALIASLSDLAGQGVEGWIAGSGFDGRPDLLDAGAKRLPLLGNDGVTVRRVRDPQAFFAVLDAAGIAHPPVRHDWPDEPSGWLLKDAAGSGGLHIVDAAGRSAQALSPSRYLQRERPGSAMSATFVADGQGAVVLGCNEQILRPRPGRRYVFGGVCGPVPVPDAVSAQVTQALHALVAAFGVRGLGSLDFLLDGDHVEVLELNPRPPASAVLYPQLGEVGPIGAHLRACRGEGLPEAPRGPACVLGNEIVYARAPLALAGRALAWLAAQPDVHDLPMDGWSGAAGDPICSVSAQGGSGAAVRERLAQRGQALLNSLETLS